MTAEIKVHPVGMLILFMIFPVLGFMRHPLRWMDDTLFFYGKVTVNVPLIAFTFQHRHRVLLATNVFLYYIHLELRLLNLLLLSHHCYLSRLFDSLIDLIVHIFKFKIYA